MIAAVSAVLWGFLDFGIIDLATAVFRDPDFAQHYVLETGWGVLYLVLVAGPFAALAVRPRTGLLLWQLGVVAVALTLAALVAGQPGHLVPATAIGATAALLWWLADAEAPVLTWRWDPAAVVAALGALPWCWYAVRMARSTFNDEITNGLTHYPAQGALGFALALGAVLIAVAATGTPGRVVATCLLSSAAFLLGVESAVNPTLVGSLGTAGGLLAAGWSLAFLLAVLLPRAGRGRTTGGGTHERDAARHPGGSVPS